jgi:hypothetical protein
VPALVQCHAAEGEVLINCREDAAFPRFERRSFRHARIATSSKESSVLTMEEVEPRQALDFSESTWNAVSFTQAD